MITEGDASWDYGFLQSLQEQLTARGTLSPRQQEVLQQIEGRYSDEALKSRAGWTESWTEDQDTKFNIALQYYRKTGYYGNIVYKYLTTAGVRCAGAPSEKEYNKLVLEQVCGWCHSQHSEEKASFPVGGTAVFRTGARTNKNKPCVLF